MSDPTYEAARTAALDRSGNEVSRLAAIGAVAEFGSRAAVETLLDLASRQDEVAAISREAGKCLASLLAKGVEVSEWDIRDLTVAAADELFG